MIVTPFQAVVAPLLALAAAQEEMVGEPAMTPADAEKLDAEVAPFAYTGALNTPWALTPGATPINPLLAPTLAYSTLPYAAGLAAPLTYAAPAPLTYVKPEPVEIEYQPIKYEYVEKEIEVPYTQYEYEYERKKREAEADPQLILGGLGYSAAVASIAPAVTYKAKEPIVKEIPITKYVPKVEKKTIKIPKPVIQVAAPTLAYSTLAAPLATAYSTAYSTPLIHALGKREAEADPQLLLGGYGYTGLAGLAGYTGLAAPYTYTAAPLTYVKPEPVEIEYQPVEYKYVEKEVEVPYVQYEYEYERKKREAEADPQLLLGGLGYATAAVAPVAPAVTYKAKEPIVKEIPITKYVPKVEKKTIKIPKPVLQVAAPTLAYSTLAAPWTYSSPLITALGK
jgi:hypothetical protein